MASFPETGLQLYKSLDYWQCKELLDISSNAKRNPGDKLQQKENDRFNSYLDKTAYNKYKWKYLDKPFNLFQIKDKTIEGNMNDS